MSNLVLYRSAEHIQSIVEVTQAAQRELRRVNSEAARLTIDTLTYTTERIQAAARSGMSEAKLEALVEEQKLYWAEMRNIAETGTRELASIVSNLRALPGS